MADMFRALFCNSEVTKFTSDRSKILEAQQPDSFFFFFWMLHLITPQRKRMTALGFMLSLQGILQFILGNSELLLKQFKIE